MVQQAGESDESKRNDLYYALKYKLSIGERLQVCLRDGQFMVDQAPAEEHPWETSTPTGPSALAQRPADVGPDDEVDASAVGVRVVDLPSPTTLGATPSVAVSAEAQELALPFASESRAPMAVSSIDATSVASLGPDFVKGAAAEVILTGPKLKMPSEVAGAIEDVKGAKERQVARRPTWWIVGFSLLLWFLLASGLLGQVLAPSLDHVFKSSALGFFVSLTLFFLLFFADWGGESKRVQEASDALRNALLKAGQSDDASEQWLKDGRLLEEGGAIAPIAFMPTVLQKRDPEVYQGLLDLVYKEDAIISEALSWAKWVLAALGCVGVSHLRHIRDLPLNGLSSLEYIGLFSCFWFCVWILQTIAYLGPKSTALFKRHGSLLDAAPEAFGLEAQALTDTISEDLQLSSSQTLSKHYGTPTSVEEE